MKSLFGLFANNVGVSVILAAIFFGAAILCGVFTATDYDNLKSVADDGVISSIETSTTRRRGRTTKKYRAVVSFTDSDHRPHKVRCIVSTKSATRYEVGKHVSVRYDPWNPDGGCLIVGDEDLVESNRFATTFLIISGGISLIVAGMGFLSKRRRERHA